MTNSELLFKVTGVEAKASVNGNFQKYYKGKCQALTKTGKQCTRDAVGSKYCWQHRKEEKGMEYPELTGTPKQVAWAYDIREKMVEGMKQAMEHRVYMLRKYHSEQVTEEGIEKFQKECLELLKYMVETKTSAKWYIDNRNVAHEIIFKNLNRERKGMELIKI